MLKKNIYRCLTIIFCWLIVTPTYADDWTGNIDGNWFNPLNWASLSLPTAATDITIDNPPVNSPTVSTPGAVAHAISLGLTSSGTLNMASGGQLTNTSTTMGDGSVASGTAVISDPGTLWTMSNNLIIGNNGTGTLVILNGAVVNNATADVGSQSNSSGTVTLDGSGTQWNNAGTLFIADQGSGTMVLTNGAVVKNIDGFVSNQNGITGFGDVIIEGAGTQWLNSGNLTIANGVNTAAALDISEGATLSAVNTVLANQTGSSATVTLENTGTVWNNTSLIIGQAGTANVTLSDSATLNVTGAAGVTIGTNSVLNIGAADGSPAVAGGQLNTPAIFLNSNANIFFNHTDTNNVVSANITGSGAITQEGTGTTVLTGINAYTGGTSISAGTLQGTSNGLQGNIINNSHLIFDQPTNGNFSGLISGSGDVTKTGAGTVFFNTPMTYTGNTVISQGTLATGAENIFTNTPTVSIAKKGVFDLAGFQQTINNLQNNGTLTLSHGGNATTNTLVVNNFSGNGTINMTADLVNNLNDFITINGSSSGIQQLVLNNPQQNVDPATDTTLKLVQTTDGLASFSGRVDAGTFEYIVRRGNNSLTTPDPHAWYLIRLDVLTGTATAAIGTYSSIVPLYYSDLQTLTARMGDLRLGDASGTWVRAFGNRMQINNQVSPAFNQNSGGIQTGFDRGFNAVWNGHINLGAFTDYLYAARQFHQNASGTTQSMSLGVYATWLHPAGWYADIVGKYSQYWNDFQATTSNGLPSNANYRVPALGGSFEAGKKFTIPGKINNFFIEPQLQLATVWVDASQYRAGNGLQVHGGSQTSLEGRLGLRTGVEVPLNNHRVLEPYLQAAVLQEFNKYNTITTNTTSFQTHLPQTIKRLGAGVASKLGEKMVLYGEYYYSVGTNFREPVSLDLGLRVSW